MRKMSWALLLLVMMAACAPQGQAQPQAALQGGASESGPAVTSTSPQLTPSPTVSQPVAPAAVVFTAAPTAAVSPTPRPTLAKNEWKNLPVIPTVSENARRIYARGLAMGNDPHAFSKVGDCQTVMPYFLGDLDGGPGVYDLGPYQDLQPVVDQFNGSFGRRSLAAKNGLTAGAVMVSLWNDWKECSKNETPLDCEYRLQRPSIAIISFGTNDVAGITSFDEKMRRVIEHTIDLGILPILATKADNLEGDYSFNATIAQLSVEYDIPLWNFWAAMQPLPEHGMRSPAHLTMGDGHYANFSDPDNVKQGMVTRNLTALQALDAVWRGVTQP